MRYRLCTLVVVLAVLTPSLALGRSERHNFRERAKLRLELQRRVEQIDKLRREPTYPYFKLDVF